MNTGHRPVASKQRVFCLALLLISLLAPRGALASESSIAPRPMSETSADDLTTWFVAVEDRILIRTRAAMYRFHPESEGWMTLTAENGLPAPPMTNICLTSDDLWLTGVGASVSDPQFDNWQPYEPGEGFPGQTIFDVESDEDYAFAATDAGFARFDRYVLEWETLSGNTEIPSGKSYNLAVGEDRVWFALSTGVAEFRKSSESFRFDQNLGQLSSPEVIALRQTTDFLWAITPAGLARYDKGLETWTSYLPGIDLPDAKINQATLIGEDLYLGTDDGLWIYRSQTGLWRRDQSCEKMPGRRVYSFSASGDLWVVTDEAFARYDEINARWIDFTTIVPIPPSTGIKLAYTNETLLLVGNDRLVYAVTDDETNPNLFQYRQREIASGGNVATESEAGWRPVLDVSGLGVRKSQTEFLTLKGGATVIIQDDDEAKQPGESDYDNLVRSTPIDVTINGRTATGRTISGFYDTTDPENDSYQISFRGTRDDNLRNLTGGEIDQQFFNSHLASGAGIEGVHLRTEFAGRSETNRRRRLAADFWAGTRRTFPGRKVFYGRQDYRLGNRDLVEESETIRIDQEVLRRNTDYTIDWKSGSFILAPHVLISSDTAIEVNYQYEISDEEDAIADPAIPLDRDLLAGQLGINASDNLFFGLNATKWNDTDQRDAYFLNLNTRLEHKTDNSFLRLTPEFALSKLSAGNIVHTTDDIETREIDNEEKTGSASGVDLAGRYRNLELTASHRSLTADLTTIADRQTLLGRLREETNLSARLKLGSNVQSTLEWRRKKSDQLPAQESTLGGATDTTASGHGTESLMLAGIRYLRHGFPNISLQRGRALVDSVGVEQEKLITRAELEFSPDQAKLKRLGIKRLWLRSFFERNQRQTSGPDKVTDHSYIRLNGSTGNPLSWNLYLENQWVHRPDGEIASGLRRLQDLNFALQSIPHRLLSTFIEVSAGRDLAWLENGGSNGFLTDRHLTSTTQIYPGQLFAFLSPLSLQFDAGKSGYEVGQTGEKLPGSKALWSSVDHASEQHDNRHTTLESRLQITSWLRLIDRLETSTGDDRNASGASSTEHRLFENRFEIRPRGGLVTIRFLTGRDKSSEIIENKRKETTDSRLSSEWTHIWGRGWQSYAALEVQRSSDHHPLPMRSWSPQIQGTYHHSKWDLNASLRLKYTYQESYNRQEPPYFRYIDREMNISSTLDLRPHQILGLKIVHSLICPRGKNWDHNLKIRLMIRA